MIEETFSSSSYPCEIRSTLICQAQFSLVPIVDIHLTYIENDVLPLLHIWYCNNPLRLHSHQHKHPTLSSE